MKLSEHFTIDELTNTSHKDLILVNKTRASGYEKVLKDLCTKILEPLRALINKPIIINSGFRSKELNDRVKGSATSQHCFGEAVDIRVNGLKADELFEIIKNNQQIFGDNLGQCILEKVGSSEWIHLSIKTERYRNILIQRYKSDEAVFLTTKDGKTYQRV